jgi:hypothetical protein
VTLELHLRIAGLLLFLLAAIHPLLPARLDWRQDLSKLTLLNRQIFIVHTLFIVLILVLFGALCWFYAEELAAPGPLPGALLGGLTVFWGLRLVVQHGSMTAASGAATGATPLSTSARRSSGPT